MSKVISPALSLVLVATVASGPALAQPKAGVVTNLDGTATAARRALPRPVVLGFRDDVFQNDRIVTGDRSLVRLLLGGKTVVTIRERSALTITEVPGQSAIDLDSGKIAVAAAGQNAAIDSAMGIAVTTFGLGGGLPPSDHADQIPRVPIGTYQPQQPPILPGGLASLPSPTQAGGGDAVRGGERETGGAAPSPRQPR